MQEEKKVTSVSEYREQAGKGMVVTCPSGANVKIRRLTPLDYIKNGLTDIPNKFFQFIADLQGGQVEEAKDVEEHVKLFSQFLKITVEKGVIDPLMTVVYSEEKEKTHLLYGELSQADQAFLIKAITGKVDGQPE